MPASSVGCACSVSGVFCVFVFFFKQKTAYEMRISDWSSDVCSSDLGTDQRLQADVARLGQEHGAQADREIGHAGRPFADVSELAREPGPGLRSEERRVGKEWVSTCRSRWTPKH